MATRKDIEDELHRRFDGKPFEDYRAFTQKVGLSFQTNTAWKPNAKLLANNFKYVCDKADKFPEWKIKLCRALDLPTPDEQEAMLTRQSLQIAERSALAAERSAGAAENSESHARSSKWAAWIAALISAVALLLGWLWRSGE